MANILLLLKCVRNYNKKGPGKPGPSYQNPTTIFYLKVLFTLVIFQPNDLSSVTTSVRV